MKSDIRVNIIFWKYALISMLPFLIAIMIIAPFQDVFYGGDDWAYAWSVQNFIESSKLQASDWATAPAVPQILWGALFVKIFGWSISILNISTIVAAFFAGLAFFYILVALNFRKSTATLSTILVTVSPLYLGMSMTFMTDSMYTSLTLLACAFYVKAILNKSSIFALIGGLFCGAAFLNRQFGIVLLIAYFLATIFWYFASSNKQCRRDISKIAFIGIIMPIFIIGISLIHPEIMGGKTIAQAYVIDTRESIMRLFDIHKILIKISIMFDYLIVLLCPLLISFFFSERKKLYYLLNSKLLLLVIALFLIAGPALWFAMTGVGIQGDVFQVNAKYGNNEILSELAFTALIILCIVPGTLLIAKTFKLIQDFYNTSTYNDFLKKFNTDSSSIVILFIFLIALGQAILTASHLSFFNNYFLPLLPFFAIYMLFVLKDMNQNIYLSSSMVMIFFLSSVLYTESTARFVEASWAEADVLVVSGKAPSTIFSWPAWYGWRNVNEVHDFMRRAVDEGNFPMNVIGIAYKDAKIHVVGSTRHPFYNEVIDRSVTYETLLGTRKLWVYEKTD